MSFQYVSKNWRQLSWSSQFFNLSIKVQRVGSNSSGSFFIRASSFYYRTRTITRISFMAHRCRIRGPGLPAPPQKTFDMLKDWRTTFRAHPCYVLDYELLFYATAL